MKLVQVKGVEVTHHKDARNFPIQGRCEILKCLILDLKSILRLARDIDTTFSAKEKFNKALKNSQTLQNASLAYKEIKPQRARLRRALRPLIN